MRIILFWCFLTFGKITLAQTQVLITDGQTGLPFVDIYNTELGLVYSTNADGYFSLPKTVDGNTVLSISYTGYETVTYQAGFIRKEGVIVLRGGTLLDEVVMIGRTDERTQDIINQIESIKAADIQRTSPQTTADALGQHSGVFIQKSQMGGGSPVVRGFEANKVLLVIDGVRMNNAIYRGGHLQNAITVDAAMLERLEVIYGPGSLVYGSDALGGVVHFRSKNPKLAVDNSPQLSGEAYVRYSSANAEKSGHIHISAGGEKFASLTSFTFSDFDNLRTGANRLSAYPDFGKRSQYVSTVGTEDIIIENENENIQVGTAYKQYDFLQKFMYQPSDKLRLLANIQHSTSSDVPRYDALTERGDDGELSFAEWYYGPQSRWLASVRADYKSTSSLFDKVISIAAFQKIDEDRIDRRFGSLSRDMMDEDVQVLSFTTDFKKAISDTWQLNYGLELTHNSVNSIASRVDISSGLVSPAGITRYPSGGSSTRSTAAYIFTKKQLSKFDLLAGLRYSYNSLSVKYLTTDDIPWPSDFYDGLTSNNAALSWSVGGLYDLGKGWKAKGQIATAFRSPNIDDLAKIRIRRDEVSVPNVQLGPESSITGELTLAKYAGKSYVSATAFQTALSDAVIRENFALPDGTDFLIDEGDTLQIVSNVNANKAKVWGVSINANYQFNEEWNMTGSTSLIKGTSQDEAGNESPLSHIPPLYGRLSIGYNSGKHNAQLIWRYNGEKPIDEYGDSTDNLENATPDGTPAWNTWNVYYNYKLTKAMRLSLSFENIFDVHYRPFSSGVSAAGRNVAVTFGMGF